MATKHTTRTQPGQAIATVHVADDVTEDERYLVADWLRKEADRVLRNAYKGRTLGHWARVTREAKR
jgi:hypothetical protein